MLDIAADVLRNPTFPEDELEKVRHEILTGIAEQEANTSAVADQSLRKLIYPAGHPLRPRVIGNAEAVNSITADDLRSFHKQHFGPNVITVATVGGFADLKELAAEIDRRFGDSATGRKTGRTARRARASDAIERRTTVEIPAKARPTSPWAGSACAIRP